MSDEDKHGENSDKKKAPESVGGDADSSVSTISDSITRPSPQADNTANNRGVDGPDFLRFLRQAGAFESELKNEDTFGASNRQNHRQDFNTLSELFESSNTNINLNHISNEDTIGRSNRSNQRPGNLASLAELFLGPPSNLPAPPLGNNNLGALSVVDEYKASSAGDPIAPPLPPRTPPPPQPARSPPPPQSPKSVLKNPSRSPTLSSVGDDSLPRTVAGGLPPRPKPLSHAQHKRSVSWGNNTTFPPPTESNSNEGLHSHQPSGSFDSVSSLGGDENNTNTSNNIHRRTNTRTQLTLDELLSNGPYEAEAESNIIRAMEKQQSNRNLRARSNSITSASLLAQVPENNLVHDFSIDESSDGKAPSSEGDHTGRSMKDGSERTRLLKINHNLHSRKNLHQRTMTVEDTLLGLTNAMAMLHEPEASGGGGTATNKKHHRRMRTNASVQDVPISSADAFAENATRIAEQQEANNGMGASSSTHHTRTRFWLVDSVPINEDDHKTSEDSEFGGDGPEVNTDLEAAMQEVEKYDSEGNMDIGDSIHSINSHKTSSRRHTILGTASDKLKSEWEAWHVFFHPRQSQIKIYIRNVLLYVVIPMTGIATILYYFCGNPTTGISTDGTPGDKASVSWWMLFAVRQVVTFSLALALQGLVIDFLALGTKIMLYLVGPVLTLLIVQSKGWPFLCFWWAILDFAFLANSSEFAHHWLHFQNAIGLFNEKNPSGSVPTSEMHTTILTVVAVVSAIVAVKRFIIGLYLGRQTFSHYGEQLAQVMKRMLLIAEVSALAKDIEKSRLAEEKITGFGAAMGWHSEGLKGIAYSDDGSVVTPMRSIGESTKVIDTSSRDPLTGSLPAHEKAKLMQLLGLWEEPRRPTDPRQIEIASISAVLRFRKALTFIQKDYPFSYAFGPADTREKCVESAQKVYSRLLMRHANEEVLHFETLALLALHDDETIDQVKAKELVKLFRPDRDGQLTILDFVKSIDSVYKEFRMLNASIQNSSQIDRAFENIFNILFYIIVITITLAQLGYNPLALFLSLSSVILGFAFMIGTASSKYFEGVLFILVRRPYGIGDRIHVSNVEKDTSIEGCPGWVVENVTLFETIATWTPTNERCSLSNGSLASSRIINAARSPQARFHVFLKFPIDTPYEKTLIFKSAIEEYMLARPREWLALNGFRAHRIEADQGYVQYFLVIQHRDSWQNIGQILDSKANLSSYCNEVARQLNMHYRAPPLPVDLRYMANGFPAGEASSNLINNNLPPGNFAMPSPAPAPPPIIATTMPISASIQPEGIDNQVKTEQQHIQQEQQEVFDREAQMKYFRQIALNKHNIRLN